MKNDMDLLKKQLKENIQKLIDAGNLKEAKALVEQYENIAINDVEAYSMNAVISMMENNLDDAKIVIKKGLNVDENNFDLNYNLAYVYEQKKDFKQALWHYNKALHNCNDGNMSKEINEIIKNIKQEHDIETIEDKKKIAFFVKQGMDSFLNDIINGISGEYETEKIVVTDFKQIDEGMQWADICWFEWCDELVIYGSKLTIAKEKEIICRLHSYEAFTDYPSKVNWNTVDKLVFVAEHIKSFVTDKFNINNEKAVVIPNGIDISKWTFKERRPGFNIAYVGYINYKKGPMLLLHTFKAIYDKNHRYKLYIAGKFQDDRDVLYFNQMIKEFGIEKNVVYEGWKDNLDKWLEDKNYILCTSILESQNMSVMQAMAKGIKPIVHNFVGAKTIYPEQYVWNTIDEAMGMIQCNENYSDEYRKYIVDNYSNKQQTKAIKMLIKVLKINDKFEESKFNYKEYSNINDTINLKKKPLVTIGITNYNGKQYLRYCVESALRQTYNNIEILLIDDCSNDGSMEIIQQYEKKYKNIKAIYHKKNSGGASKGVGEIIENSRGKYFQWIACDDFLKENAIECFVNYLEENKEKDYVYSDLNIINENNIFTGKWEYNVLPMDKVVQHIFNTGSGIIPMNCLYRKSFFIKNKVKWIIYEGNDFSADTLNSLNFIKHNFKYDKIDTAVINYRIHSNNASHNLGKRIKTSISLFDYIIKNFKEEVYFPQIGWSAIENREQLKNYMIAKYYYEQFNNNLSRRAIPNYLIVNVTNEELMLYCKAFLEMGIKYINKGLNQGDSYKIELNKLKSKYENYI